MAGRPSEPGSGERHFPAATVAVFSDTERWVVPVPMTAEPWAAGGRHRAYRLGPRACSLLR